MVSTARVQRGPSDAARCASTETAPMVHPFLSFHASTLSSIGSGQAGPSLRASNEHSFIVRVL